MLNINRLKTLTQKANKSVVTELEKLKTPDFNLSKEDSKDNRFWELTRDKAGNGFATIRFLPNTIKDDVQDELPWIKVYHHGFQGPTGKWYIENSLTTIGEKDSISELNQILWNQSDDDKSPGRQQARKQKRKLTYYANILVVDDPAKPENNGKVFLFKFGKSIYDILNDAQMPEYGKPIKVFDYWEGANFVLRSRTSDGYIKYDRSKFNDVSSIGSDEKIIKIANSQYLLSDFMKNDIKFKSYEELEKRLTIVLGE